MRTLFIKLITALGLVFISSVGHGQSPGTSVNLTKNLKAESTFNIDLYDTTYVPTVTVIASYESGKGYSVSVNRSKAEFIGKELSYSAFELVFNKLINDSLKISKTVKQNSIQEVYRMMWGLTTPNSDAAEAGIIQFNTHIIVLDDNTPQNFDRRSTIDTLISKRLLSALSSVNSAKECLWDTVKKYRIKDTDIVKQGQIANLKNSIKLDINKTKNKNDSNILKLITTYETTSKKYAELKTTFQKYSIYEIKNVEVQFERGYIERIKVWVAYKNSEYIFENIYSIGFSSPQNFRALSNTKLNIRNSDFKENPYILLSDVIRNYDNRLANYTRDYSPADTSFKVNPNNAPDVVLHREKYINLVDAKVFSDLMGIRKQNPQGLFQIELSKRFNINTVRYQVGSSRANVGYFNYAKLFGGITKIEEDQRKITLRNRGLTQNGSLITPNYATNLDYLLYENYHAGFLLNLGLFDKFDQKYTIYADFGARYGHVSVADSVLSPAGLVKNKSFYPDLHTATFQIPRLTLELFSESRINVNFSYSLNYTILMSNNSTKQVMSYAKSDLTTIILDKRARWSNTYEVFIKMAPNNDRMSHIFIRFRLYTQYGDANTSFSQFQVGYAYNWTIAR